MMFSYVSVEVLVPADHPLRAIRALVRDVLGEMSRSFAQLIRSRIQPALPKIVTAWSQATCSRNSSEGC